MSNLTPEHIAVMHRILRGELKREDIPALKTRQLRVCAAVAYILLNRKQYLTRDFSLRIKYGELLDELTGEGLGPSYCDTLVNSSRLCGLHKAASRATKERKVTLTPPPKLGIISPDTLSNTDQACVNKFVQGITKAGPKVGYAVYVELCRQFGDY